MARRKPKRATLPPVSLGGIVKEDLPLPCVHYPGHYGTFFAFSAESESMPYLCSCTRAAISNYLQLRKPLDEVERNPPFDQAAHLDKLNLPNTIRAMSVRSLDQIRFKERLCHRCNLTPPTMRYCHEMYGVRFIQHFGWYVDQTYLRFGILPRGVAYLKGITPPEYVEDIKDIKDAMADVTEASTWFRDREEYTRQRILDHSLPETEFDEEEIARRQDILRKATRHHRQAERELSKKIENIVREEFGFRKIGERWTSETLLCQIVCGIFPSTDVLRHHRPDWLGGLELDIFIPGLDLAFEYQGQQHFHPIEAWGGEEALDRQIARDKKKVMICNQRGVKLIAVDYTEPLVKDHIVARIEQESEQFSN